jgi:hypothetical protein
MTSVVPLHNEFSATTYQPRELGSSVGIATRYGLDGPGIESRGGGEIFRTCPDRPWAPPSLLYNEYRVFPGVKSGRSVTLTPHPLLVPWSWKGRAIPLLPLWAVRPVQSLSACTRGHFTFLYITPTHQYILLTNSSVLNTSLFNLNNNKSYLNTSWRNTAVHFMAQPLIIRSQITNARNGIQCGIENIYTIWDEIRCDIFVSCNWVATRWQ